MSDWLGPTDRRSAPTVTFDDQRITVAVRSFDTPPDPDPLIASLQTTFGADRVVSIEWDRVDQATTTTSALPTTTIVSDEERLTTAVEGIVDQWLADLGADAGGRRDALSIRDNVVRLDASGTIDAPSLASLTTLLDTELDRTLEVQMTWLKRENVSDAEPTPTPDQLVARTHRGPRSGVGGHAGRVGVVDDVRRCRRHDRDRRTERAGCLARRCRRSPHSSTPTTA